MSSLQKETIQPVTDEISIERSYQSPLRFVTGTAILEKFITGESDIYIMQLPALSADDLAGRRIALGSRIFNYHTQTDFYIFGKKPDSYEKFEKTIRQRIDKSNLSLGKHIYLAHIYERVTEDLKQIDRIRGECSEILLGERMKNQIFRSHIKTTFGGMKTHRDDTCMTFSAHYGPYASKQLNEKGKLEAMPVPSFACWMGTDGVALFDNSDKYNILPLAHCSPGKEEGVGEEDRLSFILPLVENRIILT